MKKMLAFVTLALLASAFAGCSGGMSASVLPSAPIQHAQIQSTDSIGGGPTGRDSIGGGPTGRESIGGGPTGIESIGGGPTGSVHAGI